MKGPKHISEVFIEMAASNSDPLGRLLRKRATTQTLNIIGIV